MKKKYCFCNKSQKFLAKQYFWYVAEFISKQKKQNQIIKEKKLEQSKTTGNATGEKKKNLKAASQALTKALREKNNITKFGKNICQWRKMS